MERFEYRAKDGTTRRFDTFEGAGLAYRDDGFPSPDHRGPRIVKITIPDPFAPEWVTVLGYAAAIIGFGDEGEVVMDEAGRQHDGTDDLMPGCASLYTEAGRAREVLGWIGTWGASAIRDGEVYLVEADGEEEEPAAEPPATVTGTSATGTPSDEDTGDGPSSDVVSGPAISGVAPATGPRITINDGGPRTVAAATFSQGAADRIEENNRWLAHLGVVRAPAPTTTAGFKPGTTVVGLGYENLATKRREWEENPEVREAADQVGIAVAREEREDVTVDTRNLQLRDDGSLDIDGRRLSIEPQGFADLLTFLRTEAGSLDGAGRPVFPALNDGEPGTLLAKARQLSALDDMDLVGAHALFPRAAQAYLAMDPDIRAAAFNRQMRYAGDRELVLRTRVAPGAPGGRAAFAVVSTGYTPFDADRVARTIADGLTRLGLGGLRGEAIYNPASATLRMDAMGHAPSDVRDFAAGDVFKAGMRFRSDDAGGGSVRGGGAAWWNECLNLIIIHAQRGEDVIRHVHKGTVEEIDRELRAGLGRHGEALRHFARQWGLLRESDIRGFSFRGVTYANVEEAVRHLVEQRELDGVGAKNALVEYTLTAYQRQGGGDTLESIIDAMTRAAHESLLAECVRERFEGAAGRLVPVLARAAEA